MKLEGRALEGLIQLPIEEDLLFMAHISPDNFILVSIRLGEVCRTLSKTFPNRRFYANGIASAQPIFQQCVP